MSFKGRVLSALGKDALLEIGRGPEFDVATRMCVHEQRPKLDAIVQKSLPRDTLTKIYSAIGLHDPGAEQATLVDRILAGLLPKLDGVPRKKPTKKSIADAAIDGVVPGGNLRTSAHSQQDAMDWLARRETGQMSEVAHTVIEIPLEGTPAHVERRVLYIWEAASYFEEVKKFASALALGRLGFEVAAPTVEGAFVRILALKNAKKPDARLALRFPEANKA